LQCHHDRCRWFGRRRRRRTGGDRRPGHGNARGQRHLDPPDHQRGPRVHRRAQTLPDHRRNAPGRGDHRDPRPRVRPEDRTAV